MSAPKWQPTPLPSATGLDAYFSYNAPPTPTYRRLAISLDGLDKRGKTHWAIMTAPGPTIVASADTGTQVIVEKARAQGRRVGLMDVTFDDPATNNRKQANIDANEWGAWKAAWANFKNGMYALINEPPGPNRTRTLVWDTGTDINNLLELNWFGKLTGNARQDVRTDMNAEFHKLFWDLYKGRPDLNILIIHKHKKVYVKQTIDGKVQNVWNGLYERKGHSQIGFFVDLTLTFDWEPLYRDFYTTILPEHPFRYHDPMRPLFSQRWYATATPQTPSAFWFLGTQVFPTSDITDWM